MAESSKTPSAASQSLLIPQGSHAGKPSLPIGSHAFALIGSRNRSHLHLLSSTISRSHACIIAAKSGMYIRDMASRTGVIVNGRKVKESDLQDGDIIQVGSFKFKFQEPLGSIHLATTPRPPLAMLEMPGGTLTPLDDRTMLIGRRPNCDIPIDAASVSSTHAIIFESDGHRYIRDLGSRTGTHVNGTAIHQHVLEVGDQIRIGDTVFHYVTAESHANAPAQDSHGIQLDSEFNGEFAEETAEEIDSQPAEPIFVPDPPAPPAAELTRPEPLPLEVAEEDQAPLPESRPAEIEPAPAHDDVVEAHWGPIDFAAAHQTLPPDLELPPVEQGFTPSVGAVESAQDVGLDFWTPEDEQAITVAALAAATSPPTIAEPDAAPIPVSEGEPRPSEPKTVPAPDAKFGNRESAEDEGLDFWTPEDEKAIEAEVLAAAAATPPPTATDAIPLDGEPDLVAAGPEPVAAEPELIANERELIAAEPELIAAEPEATAVAPMPGEVEEALPVAGHVESTELEPELEPTAAAASEALPVNLDAEFDSFFDAEPLGLEELPVQPPAAPTALLPSHVEPLAEPDRARDLHAVTEPEAVAEPARLPELQTIPEPEPVAEIVVEPAEVLPAPKAEQPPTAVAPSVSVTSVEMESAETPEDLVTPVPIEEAQAPVEAAEHREPSAPPDLKEDIDVFAAKFETESLASEPVAEDAVEMPSEPPSEPTALLNLASQTTAGIEMGALAPATEESATDLGDPLPADSVDAPTGNKRAKGPRAPRKKPPTTVRRVPGKRKGKTELSAAKADMLADVLKANASPVAPIASEPIVVAGAPEVVSPQPVAPDLAASESAASQTSSLQATAAESSAKPVDVSEGISEPQAAAPERLFRLSARESAAFEHRSVTHESTPAVSPVAAPPAEPLPSQFAAADVAPHAEPVALNESSPAEPLASPVGSEAGQTDAIEVEPLLVEAETIAPATTPVDPEIETFSLESESAGSVLEPAGMAPGNVAFFSGPASDTPPVPVESDVAFAPPNGSATVDESSVSDPEILAFAAAPMTAEAQTVIASWQNSEAAPISFESQQVSSTDQLSLPGPEADAAFPVPDSTLTAPPLEPLPPQDQVDFAMSASEPTMSDEAGAAALAELEPQFVDAEQEDFALPADGMTEAVTELPATDTVVAGVGIETIENTEPTPESALGFEPATDERLAPLPETDLVEVDTSLTDTAFGRAVQDFTGSGLGPLVEQPQPVAVADSREESIVFSESSFPHEPGLVSAAAENNIDEEFLSAELLGDEPGAGNLTAAADLSSGLSGQLPNPDQTLTSDRVPEQSPTVDVTPLPPDIILTTADAIEAKSEPAPGTEDAIAVGEESLVDLLEPDDLSAPPVAADQAPAATPPHPLISSTAGEASAQTPAVAPVEMVAPTPRGVAETRPPEPAQTSSPAAKPAIDPYFGMERDLGSFLGGMPLQFAAPQPRQPAAPAARPQTPGLPPPRLAPVSLQAKSTAPQAPPSLISPVAPIHGFAPVQRIAPAWQPPAEVQPAPVQRIAPVQQPVTQEAPTPIAEAAPVQKIAPAPEPAPAPQPETRPSPVVAEALPPMMDEAPPEALPIDFEELTEFQESADVAKDGALALDPDELLFQAEEPLELFDDNAHKLDELPDALDMIGDVGDVLGDAQPHAAAPPRATAAGAQRVASAPASAPAPAPPATPVTSPAPRVPPGFESQPPSIAAPLRSLTGGPPGGKLAAPAAPVAVPPFAGARPDARKGVSAFAGMATPPRRMNTTDIFSQTAFPPPDESMFRPQPIDIPPTTVRTPGVDSSSAARRPALRQQPGTPPGQSSSTSAAQAQSKSQQAAAPGTPAPSEDEKRRRKKWWQNIRLMLPLLVALTAAAVFVIARTFTPRTVVQGTLQIKALDKLNPMARKDQVVRLRELLRKPDLSKTVAGSLQSQGITPGFTADPTAMLSLSEPENSHFEGNLLTFKRISADPKNDQKRMEAILLAVYSLSKLPTENARAAGDQQIKTAQNKVDASQTELDSRQAALQKLSDQLRAATGTSAQDLLTNPAAAVATLRRKNEELGTALRDANSQVKAKREELARAQAVAAALPGAPIDPTMQAMGQNLTNLRSRLAAARVRTPGNVEESARAFDDAVETVSQDLMLVKLADPAPIVASYATRAVQSAAQIRQILARQKQDADDLALLRGQLAGRQETHLRQMLEADDTLKAMLEERSAQSRRYAAAVEGSNTDEASKIRGVIDDLDQKIDARRKSLVTGGQYADDLQQKLELAISSLTAERRENQREVAANVAMLEVPAASALPANEQGTMASLGERVASVQASYQQYADAAKIASGNDADTQVQLLEQEIAEQQAQLDAYQQQQHSDSAILTAARQALDAAQDSEAKAQLAFTSNLGVLASARDLTDAQARVEESRPVLAAARTDLEGQKLQARNVVQLEMPDESSAQLITEPDQRHWYMVSAGVVLTALFAAPLWLTAKDPRSEAPFASLTGGGDGEAHEEVDDYSSLHALDSERHTATA